MTDIAELERLAREASPGPWEVESYANPNGEYPIIAPVSDGEPWNIGQTFGMPNDEARANAAYIAAANPTAILALIERVAKAEAALDKIHRTLTWPSDSRAGAFPPLLPTPQDVFARAEFYEKISGEAAAIAAEAATLRQSVTR